MKSSFEFQPENPFSSSSISPSKVVYRFTHTAGGKNPQTIDNHLEGLLGQLRGHSRCLIVGPHGTGKSTLLHTFLPKLQRSFPKVAFHQLVNDPTVGFRKRLAERLAAAKRVRRELQQLPAEGLLIIDGWQQLPMLSKWGIARSAASKGLTLLATAHHRMPGWKVIHETKSTPKLIRALAGDLLDDSPYEIRKLIDNDLKSRRLPPTTNVRNLWFELYDMVEDAQTRKPLSP